MNIKKTIICFELPLYEKFLIYERDQVFEASEKEITKE